MSDFMKKIEEGRTAELTPAEVTVARRLSASLGLRKEAATAGAMICWYPPPDVAASLSVPGGEGQDALHLTLAYLGPDASEVDVEAAYAACVMISRQWGDRPGKISGTGRFVLDGDEDAYYASVDIPGLSSLYDCLWERLSSVGIWNSGEHGFFPHITLRYLPRGENSPAGLDGPVDILLDSVSLVAGGERWDFELQDWGGEGSVVSEDEARATAAVDVGKGKAKCTMCGGTGEVDGSPCPDCGEDDDVSAAKSRAVDDGFFFKILRKDDAASSDKQRTLGALYAPNRKDAHGEYIDAQDLEDAVVEYVKTGDLNLYAQHDTSVLAGKIVGILPWPYDHDIEVTVPGEKARTLTMPAGTVYAMAEWSDKAWPLVKDGTIGGFSMGGTAARAEGDGTDVPDMGDQLTPRKTK